MATIALQPKQLTFPFILVCERCVFPPIRNLTRTGMSDFPQHTPDFSIRRPYARRWLVLLLYSHIAACCLSLIYIGEYYARLHLVVFDETRPYAAVLSVALFSGVSFLFTLSRFSFGYFLRILFLHHDCRLSQDRRIFEIPLQS
jgi:hypothetical protein